MEEYVNEFDSAEEAAVEADESGEAATPETEEPEIPESESVEEDRLPKKGFQKRIDELVREREEWKRQAEQWQQVATQQAPPKQEVGRPEVSYPDLPKPKSDDFDTYDDYVEALADWKTEVKLRSVQQGQQVKSLQMRAQKFGREGNEKYEDFAKVFHDKVPVSDTLVELLLDSEKGHDVAYYLGKNPTEALLIFNLPPSRQAYEFGKLESKLANAPPPQKNETKAPPVTSPVGGKETPAKNPENMSDAEYIAWREKKLGYRR